MTVSHQKNLTLEGYLPSPYPLWSCYHDSVPWVVMVAVQSAVRCHLWATDVYPSTKCTQSYWHALLLHVTWSLHPSLVDALADIHGRSCNFPLIHLREVLLAWYWVIPRPLSSCGIISLSLPLGVGLTGVGMVHSVPCMADTHTQRNASFWCNEEESVAVEDAWLSMLVHHFVRWDACRDLMYHLTCLIFPPIFNLPLSLKGISLH